MQISQQSTVTKGVKNENTTSNVTNNEKKENFSTKETVKAETNKTPENETVNERFIRNYNKIIQECYVANEPEGSKVRHAPAEDFDKLNAELREGGLIIHTNKAMYTDEYTEAYIKMYNSNHPYSGHQYLEAQSILNSTASNNFVQP